MAKSCAAPGGAVVNAGNIGDKRGDSGKGCVGEAANCTAAAKGSGATRAKSNGAAVAGGSGRVKGRGAADAAAIVGVGRVKGRGAAEGAREGCDWSSSDNLRDVKTSNILPISNHLANCCSLCSSVFPSGQSEKGEAEVGSVSGCVSAGVSSTAVPSGPAGDVGDPVREVGISVAT